MTDKNVQIDSSVYDFVVQEARRNHRTIKGQISYMIEIARKHEERLAEIRAGQSQIDFGGIDPDPVERGR